MELADGLLGVSRHRCDVTARAGGGEAPAAPGASSGERADLARRDGTARDRRIRVGAGNVAAGRGAIELRVAAGNPRKPPRSILSGITLRPLRKLPRREVRR